eukprot:TRINITY_DN71426_c0_g1_i1.p1 TRINITY_DN71426_c0_g1~~TRINITY_DN71426_c0_g1_i1.p1  ORF type:complete len:421 (+),score=80.87 TRINITY_DN71426_c0_g1_i1:17-1279(+)
MAGQASTHAQAAMVARRDGDGHDAAAEDEGEAPTCTAASGKEDLLLALERSLVSDASCSEEEAHASEDSVAAEVAREDLLAALEESLALAPPPSPPSPARRRPRFDPAMIVDPPGESAEEGGSSSSRSGGTKGMLGRGLVNWPLEVRLGVCSCLSWREAVGYARLCRAWSKLERHDALWQVYFRLTWPRLSRRQGVCSAALRPTPWRVLFRERWTEANRGEDALEEDWLDFSAARSLTGTTLPPAAAAAAAAAEARARDDDILLQDALVRFRRELLARGVRVPEQAIKAHVCSKACRYHKLVQSRDAFLCEKSGKVHLCQQGVPCDICVLTFEEHFLVCPASGRCFPRATDASEEAARAAESALLDPGGAGESEWDPALSTYQQFGRWFEQGYSMSEEQAQDFFDRPRGGAPRSVRAGLR